MTNTNANEFAAAATAEVERTDIDIFIEGELADELRNVGPEEAGPSFVSALFTAMLGAKVELHFSNPSVFDIAEQAFASDDNIKVVLKAA